MRKKYLEQVIEDYQILLEKERDNNQKLVQLVGEELEIPIFLQERCKVVDGCAIEEITSITIYHNGQIHSQDLIALGGWNSCIYGVSYKTKDHHKFVVGLVISSECNRYFMLDLAKDTPYITSVNASLAKDLQLERIKMHDIKKEKQND